MTWRRGLNLAGLLSLVFCLAATALWIRSIWYADELNFYRVPRSTIAINLDPDRMVAFRTESCGQLLVVISKFSTQWFDSNYHEIPASQVQLRWRLDRLQGLRLLARQLLPAQRVRYETVVDGTGEIDHYIGIPIPAIVLALIILPAVHLMRFIRLRRQKRSGACRTCYYNLTANTSGVCPECGTATLSPPRSL